MLQSLQHRSAASKIEPKNISLIFRRILLLLLLAVVGALLAVAFWLWSTVPIEKSEQPLVPARIVLLTRDGVPFAANGPLMSDAVEVKTLPPHVAQAFYAIEDRRFQHHFGVDPIGIGRALLNNLAGKNQQGGSTITQQLAKNVYLIDPDTGRPYPGYSRKLREIAIALWLEIWLTKDQILERYLSNVAFGKNIYGLRAASLHYFYRQPERLTLPQAIMLAGLVQAPSSYDPRSNEARARARAMRVARAMQDAGYLPGGAAGLPAIAELDIRIEQPLRTGFYFSDWVIEEARARAGSGHSEKRVVTTLDGALQIAAQDVARDLSPPGADVALVAMRPNGEVVAMIGGRDYARSQFNIAVSGRRQPGSTFKLFTYLTALQTGMRPDATISNAPITEGDYRPVNGDGYYSDRLSLADAFAVSSNVAAVRLFERLGADPVVDTARALGVTTPVRMNPSLALGTSDVSLLQMTAAYAAIAAGQAPVRPIGLPPLEAVSDTGPVPLDPRVVRDMRLMLARVVTDGSGQAARLPIPAYGKTGTTQNNRDAWFIGFAGELVVGVWLGNDSDTRIEGMSGGEAAARLWKAFMVRAIAADRLSTSAARPEASGSGQGLGARNDSGRAGPMVEGDGGALGGSGRQLRSDDGRPIDLSPPAPLPPDERSSDHRPGRGTGQGAASAIAGAAEAMRPGSRPRPPERGARSQPRVVAPGGERPGTRRRFTDDEDEDFTIECGDASC